MLTGDVTLHTHTVLDLAARFADGRLTTQKLLDADDEELHRMLTEVRGIGTVRTLRDSRLCDLADK